MTTFRDSILRLCPPWLRRQWGERFLYLSGLLADGQAERSMQGIKARFPGLGTPEALTMIGNDRKIVRGFDEPDAAYAARLRSWLDDHRIRGGPVALFRQLRGYLTPTAVKLRTVDDTGNWKTWDAGSTVLQRTTEAWDWDAFDRWWRFWVFVYTESGPFTRRVWGSGTWGQGTWGSSATREQIDSLKQIVRDWKPDHAHPVAICLCFDDDAFDPSTHTDFPDGTWDLHGNRRGDVAYIEGIV